MHKASQRKRTRTTTGIWQSDVDTGGSKAENALNSQQASFERAAHIIKQAARDEVHVAVAQTPEMSRAEMLARTGALEHRADPF